MSGFGQFLPFAAIAVLFYFLIIKPENDKKSAHDALLASLVKDDWVVTDSGIYGRLTSVSTETVSVEIADKAIITLEKSSVARRIEDGADFKK